MMHRPCFFLAACLLAMAALVAVTSGCGRTSPAATQNTDAARTLERVVAGSPERKTFVLSTTQPGRVEAFEETPLYAKLAGYVDQVLADIGDVVRKDQVLIKLSIPELLDDLEQKEALVAQAEAQVKQAESSVAAASAAVETAQSRIVEADAGIERAEADHQRWQSEHARIKELADKGSVTRKLEDETLSQLQSAEAAKREATAKAQSARSASYESQANVSRAEADRGAAEARLRVARANLARARTMAGYTEIKAPYDGTVTRRDADTGHYVYPSTGGSGKPLMTVARTDHVRIFVDVPEMEAPHVDAGDPAQVRVQSLGGKPFDAEVVRTSWSLSPSNRSLRTEINVANPDGLLRPGMYAMVAIRLAEHADSLTVPAAAIVRDGDATFCVCVVSGKIERMPVELGLRDGKEVEILAGLEEGQTIVLRQPESFAPGQQVSAASATE